MLINFTVAESPSRFLKHVHRTKTTTVKMTGKETAAGGSAMTDTQLKFVASMMRNMQSKPDIDWDKVASEHGMTAKSARERHRILSLKFGWNAKSGGDGDSPGPKTPKKAAGVTKRTGRFGDSAKKARGKKAAAENVEDSTDDLGKGDCEMDDAGEA
ncbi:hypothetical protein N0V82_005458 [Gnomoniopsis sp. IMI 355080]|nr:hypothetical protein N0V82_005458 [Gnomoniopsis sp. IMI 355080]